MQKNFIYIVAIREQLVKNDVKKLKNNLISNIQELERLDKIYKIWNLTLENRKVRNFKETALTDSLIANRELENRSTSTYKDICKNYLKDFNYNLHREIGLGVTRKITDEMRNYKSRLDAHNYELQENLQRIQKAAEENMKKAYAEISPEDMHALNKRAYFDSISIKEENIENIVLAPSIYFLFFCNMANKKKPLWTDVKETFVKETLAQGIQNSRSNKHPKQQKSRRKKKTEYWWRQPWIKEFIAKVCRRDKLFVSDNKNANKESIRNLDLQNKVFYRFLNLGHKYAPFTRWELEETRKNRGKMTKERVDAINNYFTVRRLAKNPHIQGVPSHLRDTVERIKRERLPEKHIRERICDFEEFISRGKATNLRGQFRTKALCSRNYVCFIHNKDTPYEYTNVNISDEEVDNLSPGAQEEHFRNILYHGLTLEQIHYLQTLKWFQYGNIISNLSKENIEELGLEDSRFQNFRWFMFNDTPGERPLPIDRKNTVAYSISTGDLDYPSLRRFWNGVEGSRKHKKNNKLGNCYDLQKIETLARGHRKRENDSAPLFQNLVDQFEKQLEINERSLELFIEHKNRTKKCMEVVKVPNEVAKFVARNSVVFKLDGLNNSLNSAGTGGKRKLRRHIDVNDVFRIIMENTNPSKDRKTREKRARRRQFEVAQAKYEEGRRMSYEELLGKVLKQEMGGSENALLYMKEMAQYNLTPPLYLVLMLVNLQCSGKSSTFKRTLWHLSNRLGGAGKTTLLKILTSLYKSQVRNVTTGVAEVGSKRARYLVAKHQAMYSCLPKVLLFDVPNNVSFKALMGILIELEMLTNIVFMSSMFNPKSIRGEPRVALVLSNFSTDEQNWGPNQCVTDNNYGAVLSLNEPFPWITRRNEEWRGTYEKTDGEDGNPRGEKARGEILNNYRRVIGLLDYKTLPIEPFAVTVRDVFRKALTQFRAFHIILPELNLKDMYEKARELSGMKNPSDAFVFNFRNREVMRETQGSELKLGDFKPSDLKHLLTDRNYITWVKNLQNQTKTKRNGVSRRIRDFIKGLYGLKNIFIGLFIKNNMVKFRADQLNSKNWLARRQRDYLEQERIIEDLKQHRSQPSDRDVDRAIERLLLASRGVTGVPPVRGLRLLPVFESLIPYYSKDHLLYIYSNPHLPYSVDCWLNRTGSIGLDEIFTDRDGKVAKIGRQAVNPYYTFSLRELSSEKEDVRHEVPRELTSPNETEIYKRIINELFKEPEPEDGDDPDINMEDINNEQVNEALENEKDTESDTESDTEND